MRQGLRRASALALIVGLTALGGCGGDDDEGSTAAESTPEATATATATETPAATAEAEGGGGEALEVTAGEDGGLSFDPKELTAKAGTVTIKLTSPDGNALPHAVEVEGNGVEEKSDTIQGGAEAEVSADLKAGEYVYYCPVGQHRQGGMEGTLTVE